MASVANVVVVKKKKRRQRTEKDNAYKLIPKKIVCPNCICIFKARKWKDSGVPQAECRAIYKVHQHFY